MEFSLLGAALVGIASMYAVLYVEARRGNAADCTRSVWDTALTAGIAGLIVGRLAAMVLTGTNPVANPADVLVVRGGVDTVWAVVGAAAAFAVLARGEVAVLADAAAAAVLAGLAGWHAGCLLRESCLGTASELPWAYALPGSAVTRHPVELYAALLLVMAAAAVAALRRRRPPAGVVAAVALAAAAGARLLTEPMRPALGGSIGAWYAVGVGVGIGAAIWSWRRSEQH